MDQLLQQAQQRGSEAHQLYHKGKYEESLALYKEMLKTDPKDDLSMLGVADCLLSLKRYDEAKKAYEVFIEQGSNKFKAHGFCNYALCLSKEGENSDTIDSLMDLALKSQSEEFQCIQVLCLVADHFCNKLQLDNGLTEEETQNYLELIRKCIDKIDEIDPLYSDGLVIKGNYYSQIGAEQSAIQAYEELIQLQPNDYRGYYNLALSLTKQGQYQQAINLFLKSDLMNKENKNFALKSAFQTAKKAKSMDLALFIMEKKLQQQPKSSQVYQETVTACILMQKMSAAVMIAQNWTSECPDDIIAWQFLAELTYTSQIYDLAEKAYLNLNRLTEYKDHSFINVLAAINLSRKNYEKSFEYCLKSLEVKYDYPFAFRNLSEFRQHYSKEKFYQFYDDYTSKYPMNTAAQEYINRIKESFPEDVEYLNKKFAENQSLVKKLENKSQETKQNEGCCGGHDHHHH
ncbi:tetratricopeptide repeat protein (macronuclear) [Tetrahymena thermophila SB210]|uniref:Tetratricopeptide repeat protein n=1 Tax=Tetrahymena thermophila (strain SB210) TaxID=312017 RepID=Q239S1_TETTS|nr:tetratricopeptide repeat protein [Tetrahymena thermophila SB210]EAR93275.2 tetratricopeptide repeat protein [Tetrahymena thermophila SB210]|eukprot:XP_001013520.2 tetratricopeptide repeat protein [Tetrahymena thermophila SB210]